MEEKNVVEEQEKEEKKSKRGSRGGKKKGNNKENQLKEELKEAEDKHLRLFAEFDNYKKRTAKERIELIQNASRELVVELLPVLDDFERGLGQVKSEDDGKGMELIYNKLKTTLENKGLKPMDAVGQPFDTELHEAITEIPAPSEEQKNTIIDVIEKGYYLNDKIIRYAKVVVGK